MWNDNLRGWCAAAFAILGSAACSRRNPQRIFHVRPEPSTMGAWGRWMSASNLIQCRDD